MSKRPNPRAQRPSTPLPSFGSDVASQPALDGAAAAHVVDHATRAQAAVVTDNLVSLVAGERVTADGLAGDVARLDASCVTVAEAAIAGLRGPIADMRAAAARGDLDAYLAASLRLDAAMVSAVTRLARALVLRRHFGPACLPTVASRGEPYGHRADATTVRDLLLSSQAEQQACDFFTYSAALIAEPGATSAPRRAAATAATGAFVAGCGPNAVQRPLSACLTPLKTLPASEQLEHARREDSIRSVLLQVGERAAELVASVAAAAPPDANPEAGAARRAGADAPPPSHAHYEGVDIQEGDLPGP